MNICLLIHLYLCACIHPLSEYIVTGHLLSARQLGAEWSTLVFFLYGMSSLAGKRHRHETIDYYIIVAIVLHRNVEYEVEAK